MSADRPSEPPEEPHLRSEPSLLSPTSPKPLHFPTPTNIPVLEMQMDVGFNQTEAHMSDPAMHNTDVRPDFWRDPNDPNEDAEVASPFSTGGGEAMETAREEEAVEQQLEPVSIADAVTDTSTAAAPNGEILEPALASNHSSHQANATLDAEVEHQASLAEPLPTSSDPSVPAASNTAHADDSIPLHEVSEPSFELAQPAPVDVQALLDTLTSAPQPHDSSQSTNIITSHSDPQAPPRIESSPISAAGLGAPPSGLPPRPPPQEQPLIHPNYLHSQHIRDYHPHAAHPAFQPQQPRTSTSTGNVADPSSRNYVPPVHSPSSAQVQQQPAPPALDASVQYFASPNSASPNTALVTPLSAQFSTSSTPIESRRETKLAAGEVPNAEDRPWDAQVQQKYDRFIEEERKYVSEGRWEQFPQGSRLFVGNLSSEKVTKRDIFHVFHMYGELAQISIKQAYGFVQFLRTEDCMRALEVEQGTQIRDKRIHLEISKPQKNRTQQQQPQQRRSRSPDNARGGRAPANVDRYVSGGGSGRGGQNRGSRDSYGGNSARFQPRSPSPRGGGYRDRYDDRYPARSRSPFGGRNGGGQRFVRSPSPRGRGGEDDDLPLPRRNPRDVPDVQILVLEPLERDFISWVESGFSTRGVRVDVLILSPRLSEPAVVRRQIVEGVLAVVKLTRQSQDQAKIGLVVFDRRKGGVGSDVSFDEYQGLEPNVCAELVLRARATATMQQQQPQPPMYGGGGAPAYGGGGYMPPPQHYGMPPAPGPPAPPYGHYAPTPAYGQPPQTLPPASAAPPNLQHLITGLDSTGLQNLLSAMNQQQSPHTPQTAGSYATSAQQYGGFAQQQQAAMAALQRNPQAVAGLLGQQQQQGGGAQVSMQEILARLGTYRQ